MKIKYIKKDVTGSELEWFKDLFLKSEVREFKAEKREFLLKHKYVFGAMTPKEAEIVKFYYGLYDDKFYTTTEIANVYRCSKAFVANALTRTLRRLQSSPVMTLLLNNVTDGDINCTINNYMEFTEPVLNELVKEYRRQNDVREAKKFNDMPEEDKIIYRCLEIALNKNFHRYFEKNDRKIKGIFFPAGATIKDVLKYPELMEGSLKNKNKDIISKFKSLGLSFCGKDQDIEEWKMKCCQDISKVGIDKFKEFFGLDNISYDNILYQNIDVLNLTKRAYNALIRSGVRTVEELVSLKERQLLKIKNMGEESVRDIKFKLNDHELAICPEMYTGDMWVKKLSLLHSQGVKSEEEFSSLKELIDFSKKPTGLRKENMDINEIPEKYREIYSIGAGEVAKREIENEATFGQMKSMLMTKKQDKIIARIDKKVSKSKGTKVSEEELLEEISKDIKLILNLKPAFLRKNREKLKRIVLDDNVVDVKTRFKILDYVLHPTKNITM